MASAPNILFLFTDDQRFDTIRALGNDQIYTPNMDYLVQNGTAFTQAYIMGGSSGAVCMPSRAMMLTGRYLYRIQDEGQAIPPEYVMLPEVFRQAGYATFGTGKWHNGAESYARAFTDGGEIFFGGMDDHWNVAACDFRPSGQYPDPTPHVFPWHLDEWRTIEFPYDHTHRGYHSTELFADTVRDFLLWHDTEQPFFAYVPFMAPHDPRTMPQRFLTQYDPEAISLPENYMAEHPFDNGALATRDETLEDWPRRPERIRRHLREYYAMITHLDDAIGRILDALKATRQFENTIIVLAGDNGLALGQHGLMGKQNVYEHSVHVPLVMMGPGIPRGETRDTLCYLLDIFPTLCELTGQPIPATVDGRSLVPVFAQPDVAVRDMLHFAFTDLQRSVRTRRYKLIEYVVGESRVTQLFDLHADPAERNNLAGEPAYGEVLMQLRRELRRWQTELGDHQAQGQRFWQQIEL